MNNNQFKKEVRKQIEHFCELNLIHCIYNDTDASTRMYYLYYSNMEPAGSMRFYFSRSSVSYRFSSSQDEEVSLVNCTFSAQSSYMRILDVYEAIESFISSIRKEESNEVSATAV